MPDPDDDKTVKDLLGSASREDLERWFGLPSYEQLADEGVVPPEVQEAEDAKATTRAQALAAADPAFVAQKFARGEAFATALREPPPWQLMIAENGIQLFDEKIVTRLGAVEPREYSLPDALQTHMEENAPQALLRDLHRPETDFSKFFEIVDVAAAQRMDIIAVIAKAIRTDYHLTLERELPSTTVRATLRTIRAERLESWLESPAHVKAMEPKLSPDDAEAAAAEAALWTSMSGS